MLDQDKSESFLARETYFRVFAIAKTRERDQGRSAPVVLGTLSQVLLFELLIAFTPRQC